MKLKKKKISSREIAELSRYLSILFRAGISIDRTLEIVESQISNKEIKKILSDIRKDVYRGNYLYESWKLNGRYFPKLFLNMIEIGEESGNMDRVFIELENYYSNKAKRDRDILSSLLYPMILLIITIIVFAIIILFIIPNFISIFEELDIELPIFSKIILSIGSFFKSNFIFISVLISILILISLRVLKVPKYKFKINSLAIKLPLFGKTVKNINIVQISKILHIMISSGANLNDSIELTIQSISNSVFKKSLMDLNRNLNIGNSIYSSIKNEYIYPEIFKNIILVGEETGNIEESFNLLSNFFEEELSNSLKTLVGIIEPTMIILISILVFFVIMTVFLPMINLYESIGI